MPDIRNALNIQGFMYQAELEWLADRASRHSVIVEIGSWRGRSTRAIADNAPGIVYAVDTWKGTSSELENMELLRNHHPGWLREEFNRNMEGLRNVTAVQMTSLEAATYLSNIRFDMIFIDADHSYEAVKADILAWRPLLSENDLLCGHDYEKGFPGLVRAVRELLPEAHLANAEGKEVGEMGFSIWTNR